MWLSRSKSEQLLLILERSKLLRPVEAKHESVQSDFSTRPEVGPEDGDEAGVEAEPASGEATLGEATLGEATLGEAGPGEAVAGEAAPWKAAPGEPGELAVLAGPGKYL
jgi:hypothetical protein